MCRVSDLNSLSDCVFYPETPGGESHLSHLIYDIPDATLTMNLQAHEDLGTEHNISELPTLLYFNKGQHTEFHGKVRCSLAAIHNFPPMRSFPYLFCFHGIFR